MSQRKPGKPEDYSEKQLKELLSVYRKKHQGVISFSGLEKATGISRKTWKRRMGEVIEELNQIVTLQNARIGDDELPLPNIDLIFDKFSSNPKGLRDALFHLNEVILKTYEENIKLQETVDEKNKVEKELNIKVEKLEKEKSKLSNEVAYYEKVMIESMNPSMRKRIGIKNNLIEINKHNQESAASLEIEEEFPELFGDLDKE
ncbi:hypothetical protein HMPREF9372_1800 [Sporosarcina newyorkensis 2681]|uniref:Uncharacterized protein n=1 Tax=Sporosarcina newyorkensis 2681 TaxID=1027292 RepID=F9DSL9_9BACL|nr:hypothetical protein [Sporosarcina newyorkensis]EGQ26193.1 hypothetical protein HMPREF9372_1800 [Sporosarcina newyorkensis 2681]